MSDFRRRVSAEEDEILRIVRGMRQGEALKILQGATGSNLSSDAFVIPEGEGDYVEPLVISGKLKIGALMDPHVPYHCKLSLTTAVNHLIREGIDILLLNGDFIDFYELSDHQKLKAKRSTETEIEIARLILTELRRAFPRTRIIYKEGNHETRLPRFVMNNCPELANVASLGIANLLDFASNSIELVRDNQLIQAGKLLVIHGHEIAGGGESFAKSKLMKLLNSVLFGHHHRKQEFIAKSVDGSNIAAFGVGCLCDRSPNWFPFNQWQHGFAVIHLEEDGWFRVENRLIQNGRVV